jgi:hypothetical protein
MIIFTSNTFHLQPHVHVHVKCTISLFMDKETAIYPIANNSCNVQCFEVVMASCGIYNIYAHNSINALDKTCWQSAYERFRLQLSMKHYRIPYNALHERFKGFAL